MWLGLYVVNWLIAVLLCTLVGFLPDEFLYSHFQGRFGDLPFCTTLLAFVLGFLIGRKRRDPVAHWIFLPGLFLFADGIYESTRSWPFPATASARIQFLVINAFGVKPGCEGDCFGAIGALMLLPSLAYSLGTFIAIHLVKDTGRERPIH